MRFGITLPNLGLEGGPDIYCDLAVEAEDNGWDGVFVWDCVWSSDWDPHRAWDPWVLLSSMASRTSRVRLGTMVTPLSRRRPWKVAAETATLDHLSGGRLVLPVSLGWAPDGAFSKVNEPADRRVRAERLDEALEIVAGLWRGEPFSFKGEHFEVDALPLPPCLQQPRIPVWVVGAWPRRKSMARVLRWDGVIPAVWSPEYTTWLEPRADQLGEIAAAVGERDVIVEGYTSRDHEKATAKVQPFAEAGATWWVEGVWQLLREGAAAVDRMRSRIAAGPPRFAGCD
jgi:alkanesulfonate monooxygenase SsuD/methylene tetrahydromethanopterin reductase-like flavin-dependent oxidoreductase (luciferase family)